MMTEQEAFNQIDNSIKEFKQKEGLYKGIEVSAKPKSDWLIFNWRQITWTENDLHYLIEVYPNFNKQEEISDWNMYAAVYFDQDKKRYYTSKKFSDHRTIDFIASNASSLLQDCFKYLSNIKKPDIPFAVVLQ